ncbi:hypothetical protein Back2_14710 [Nocardioides baekrokdamisoli]|uniref:Uncharacterized protein n=1 Tax=Nocardioides baekrokdamisoli TaxID=1804624 RepID=A0A3G9J143_9ACTN|nr:hypothetical protein Back2_14710 [Nocardioides baekrokdamisoli]
MQAGHGLPPGCPPLGHAAAQGTFYRLTSPGLSVGQAADEGWTLPVANKTSAAYQQLDNCFAYAYSVFRDIEDLIAARELIGWARKKTIARVDLSPPLGRTLRTWSPIGPSHHDWWPSTDDLVPPTTVVAEQVA